MFIKLTDYYNDKPFVIRPERIDGIRQYEENCEIWCNHFCVLVKESQEEIIKMIEDSWGPKIKSLEK
jgi:uncharacterized protein YlzI (FlbEa/FlbD family)